MLSSLAGLQFEANRVHLAVRSARQVMELKLENFCLGRVILVFFYQFYGFDP